MMLRTIPIYWGCSDISKFYNKEGIITFQNPDDLIKITNTLTPEYYYSKKEIIEENFNRVKEHQEYEQRISDKITEIFRLNNLI